MPKILFLDIETSPNLVYVWGLWDQNVAINQIVESGHTLCWAAQWQGEKEIMFSAIWKDGRRKMVKRIHDLLSEADIVVHYNGKRFDIPTLNKEFLLHGFTPPAPYKQVDLLEVVKKKFRFPSNKMDFIAQALEIGAKVEHKGMELWRGCMAGNKEDQAAMEEYNRQDVNLLSPIYTRVLPWVDNHPNVGLFVDTTEPVCSHCGSSHIQSRGPRKHERTGVALYQRFQCQDCGKWLRGGQNELPKDKRAVLLRGVQS